MTDRPNGKKKFDDSYNRIDTISALVDGQTNRDSKSRSPYQYNSVEKLTYISSDVYLIWLASLGPYVCETY